MICVIPFFSGDSWLARKNLEWAKELDGTLPYECVLSCDDKTNPAEVIEVASTLFKKVHLNQYPRIQQEAWPWPQNNAFCQTARFMPKFNQPWFWWETDSVPIRKGWLQTLEQEYLKGGMPFGGHWNPKTNIFNGVAIYPSSVARHCPDAVMTDLLEPKKMPNGSLYQPPWDFYCSPKVLPKLHIMNEVMQHIWEIDGKCPTFPDAESVSQIVRASAVIFHRVKDGSLIDRLREAKARDQQIQFESQLAADAVHVEKLSGTPQVEILIVTYHKDAEFVNYCLASIEKFAKGFYGVTVVAPKRDESVFEPIVKKPFRLKLFDEAEGKGMLHHMAIKCMAEQFVRAPYCLHMDSDCILNAPVSPQDWFVNGKPIMFAEPFEAFKKTYPIRYGWKAAVKRAIGIDAIYETMLTPCHLHPTWIYPLLRQHVEKHTGKSFLDFALDGKNDFPQHWTEFPTLGAFAWKFHRDKYHWIDVTKDKAEPLKVTQFWSHGGIDGHQDVDLIKGSTQRARIERILAA